MNHQYYYLNLEKYKFDLSNSSNNGHPLRLYLDVDKNRETKMRMTRLDEFRMKWKEFDRSNFSFLKM